MPQEIRDLMPKLSWNLEISFRVSLKIETFERREIKWGVCRF